MSRIEEAFRGLLSEQSKKRSESPKLQEKYNKPYDEYVKAQFKELSTRLKQEKEERRKKKEVLDRREAEKLQKEIELEHEAEERRLEEAKEQREQKLKEMHHKGELRKAELEANKIKLQESPPIRKPVYKIIQERYMAEFEIPEIEEKKAYLAKKKLLFQPMNHQEIQEHYRRQKLKSVENSLRKQKQLKEQAIDNRVHSSMVSKPMNSYMETIKEEEKEKEKHKAFKSQLKEKRERYSLLVREMFTPRVDTNKQQEMERIKNRVSKSLPRREIKFERRNLDNPEIFTFSINSAYKITKKSKSVVPHTSAIPHKTTDYLADRRSEREKLGKKLEDGYETPKLNFDSQMKKQDKLNSIRNQARLLQAFARRSQNFTKLAGPANLKAIQIENEVDQLLFDSIKAKFSLLNN